MSITRMGGDSFTNRSAEDAGLAAPTGPSASFAVAPADAAPSDLSADPYVGMVLGDRYRVVSKLGEGGMGSVYLAEHRIIGKKVAVKVLSEDFARKPTLKLRFVQEARAVTHIGHENIVEIYDFGETPNGSVFFAMELLEGTDLAGHIRASGGLDFERIRHITIQICRALGAAHDKGIIHRDLKPENIYLVDRAGDSDFVKILDFGIAKVSGIDGTAAATHLTQNGMIFGTPAYMAPEQARGEPADGRLDVYALGCIVYEMLTGDVPIRAPSFMSVLQKQITEIPELPSLRASDRGITADVDRVVMKALAKDREERFATMRDFAAAIAACDGGEVTEAWGDEATPREPVPFSGTSASPRRHRSGHTSPAALAVKLTSSSREAATATAAAMTTVTGTTTGTTTETGAAAVASSRPLRWLPATAIGAVFVGAIALIGLKLRAPAHDPWISLATASAPTYSVEPPSVDRVTISLDSTPPGATVFRGAEQLGVTPLQLPLAVGHAPVTLLLRKPNFRDHSAVVTPDTNRAYQFELESFSPPRPPVVTPRDTAKMERPHPPRPTPVGSRLSDLKRPYE